MAGFLAGLLCGLVLGWVARRAYMRRTLRRHDEGMLPKFDTLREVSQALDAGQPTSLLGWAESIGALTPEGQVKSYEAWDRTDLVIRVSDWGPDFTGEGKSLHRWRWAVWSDVGSRLQQEIDVEHGQIVGVDVPHMLGNEPTEEDASIEAMEYVNGRWGPGVSVRFERVFPNEATTP